MNFLVSLAIASSLQFFGVSILIDYGTQSSHNHKPSKSKVKSKANPKPGRILTSSKPSDAFFHKEKDYTYVKEVEKGDNNNTKDEQRISGKRKAQKLGRKGHI